MSASRRAYGPRVAARPYYLGDPLHNNIITHGAVNPYAFGPPNSPLRFMEACPYPGCSSVSFVFSTYIYCASNLYTIFF